MKRIKLSVEAFCADSSACCTQKNRKNWVEEHDLFVGSDGRAYALVDTPRHVFFMDAITGALFAQGGHIGGDRQVTSFTRNEKKAKAFLMNQFLDTEPYAKSISQSIKSRREAA